MKLYLNMTSTSAIVEASAYTKMIYKGKTGGAPMLTLRNLPIQLEPGQVFGIRKSSNGKQWRVIFGEPSGKLNTSRVASTFDGSHSQLIRSSVLFKTPAFDLPKTKRSSAPADAKAIVSAVLKFKEDESTFWKVIDAIQWGKKTTNFKSVASAIRAAFASSKEAASFAKKFTKMLDAKAIQVADSVLLSDQKITKLAQIGRDRAVDQSYTVVGLGKEAFNAVMKNPLAYVQASEAATVEGLNYCFDMAEEDAPLIGTKPQISKKDNKVSNPSKVSIAQYERAKVVMAGLRSGGGSWAKSVPQFVKDCKKLFPEIVAEIKEAKAVVPTAPLLKLFKAMTYSAAHLDGAKREQLASLVEKLRA